MNKIQSFLRQRVHNLLLLLKYHLYGKAVEPMIVYMMDGSMHHMGLTDRIRQIMGIYALCKHKGYKFGLRANYPFDLSDYLIPKYNWKITNENFSKNIFFTRPLYLGYRTKEKYKSLLTLRRRQLHVYASVHYSFVQDFGFEMHQLFHELFEPIPTIKNFINKQKEQFGKWDCVHFRFINLLGDFYEPQSNQLNPQEKEDLILKCYQFVVQESEKIPHNLLVCSDSQTFLRKVSSIPKIIILPGNPIHIDYTKETDFDFHLKTFLDFFMISESVNVRSIISGKMYPSWFPELAANINNIKFERVILP